MTQPNQCELTKDELLIIFMAELGWAYEKYDDQCFHIFDSSGNNTMTRETASALKAYITTNYTPNTTVEQLKSRIAWLEGKVEGLQPKKKPRFEA